jgi:hypothetical protein
VILIDSSAWIEFLRGSEHPVRGLIRAMLGEGAPIATTEVVAMELLAGARSEGEANDIRSRLVAFEMLVLDGLADFEGAADLFRTCRRAGETIRNMADCLIAVPAIRAGAAVLHKDRDFDAIARHSDLRVHQV